jgi:hypothetical protein
VKVAKEKTHTAKALQKKWRKRKANRTKIIGVLATAQMNPRCKILCDMNSSSTKMLQLPRKMRGSNCKILQNAVEMAVSSSKMP